jgi:acetoin utilization deacetylase AcuC-like enzyme
MSILTFDNQKHHLHAPQFEQLHGQLVPYFESPTRIETIRQQLSSAGLINLQPVTETVTLDQLANVHDRAMLEELRSTSQNARQLIQAEFDGYTMGDRAPQGDAYFYETNFPPTHLMRHRNRQLRGFYSYDSTCPIGTGTWEAITHSASIAHTGAQAILNGQKEAYALCRPPGHHAGRNFIGGYCYINNAAVSAHTLKSLGKVAILDIDYHHGNGTQDIFWDDPDVLLISLHGDPQYEYPYYSGFAEEKGSDQALGTTINYPLPAKTSETDYLQTLERALADIQAYTPASLVVSLGFDTYIDDPISQFEVTLAGYTKIGRKIADLNLPTLYIQEGGYAVEALGAMAQAFFSGVLGR